LSEKIFPLQSQTAILNAKRLLAFMFVVKEAVQRAELDASLAAEDAVRHGHKAESRITGNKGSSEQTEGSTDHVTGKDKPSLHVRTHASLGTLNSFIFSVEI